MACVAADTDFVHLRAHPEEVQRPLHPPEDVEHAGWWQEVDQTAVLLAAATIIAVLVLLVAALLPREAHPAPARPTPATVTD